MIYRPYGQRLVAGEDNFRFKFNSHEQDASGLQYFNARYYDPEIGRFAQADPTVPDPLNSQAYNRYMFCYGNPISFIDVNGFESTEGGNQGTVTNVGPDGQVAFTPSGIGGAPTATVTWGDPGESKGTKGKGGPGNGGDGNGEGGDSEGTVAGDDSKGDNKGGGNPSGPGSRTSMFGPGHNDTAPSYNPYQKNPGKPNTYSPGIVSRNMVSSQQKTYQAYLYNEINRQYNDTKTGFDIGGYISATGVKGAGLDVCGTISIPRLLKANSIKGVVKSTAVTLLSFFKILTPSKSLY